MSTLDRIRQRHLLIKSHSQPMTEAVARRRFPRRFTRWLNLGLLRQREDGLFEFVLKPVFKEDKLIYDISSHPNSTTSEVCSRTGMAYGLTYNNLHTLKSRAGLFEYENGRWAISPNIDLSFLYWSNGSSLLSNPEDLIGSLSRHLREVFNAKNSVATVEREYVDAQRSLVEKKENFKQALEQLDLI